MNHTRFPKEKHLPYWARRGNKDKKGDRVECDDDDEHLRSKHVEAWNKLIIKFSASSWLILR